MEEFKPARLWAVVAITSPFSEVVAQLVTGGVPPQLLWFRIAVLISVVAAGFIWSQWRDLRAFSLAYLYQLLAVALFGAVRESGKYQSLREDRGFVGSQGLLSVAFVVALVPAILWLIPRSASFYFRIGDLRAPVDLPGSPRKPLPWSVAAPLFAVISAVTTWAFVAFEGSSAGASALMAAFAVLFAAINAFGEEFLNRTLLVPTVQKNFGSMHALLVSAFIFGIGHWNGLPAGPLGVAMTFILGFVAAKAMVDTKGIFWPWIMHWIPDCVLFYYWGIGSVAHATIGSGHL
jgi:membrane protease YdiL (CAAX protease family)